MKRALHSRAACAGFSLLEALIATGLLGLVAANVTMVVRASSRAYESTAGQASLEVLAGQTLDRIAMALTAASRDGIDPGNSPPLHSSQIQFQTSLGMQDGEMVWSDPERIALDLQNYHVVWTQNPETESARSIVWGKDIRGWSKDELPDNLLDDNGNALVDELGLAFSLEGDSVLIRLTLEKRNEAGVTLTCARQTRITCRN